MTWWLWMLIGMLIVTAQLATTVAVCRAAAVGDQQVLRAQRRRSVQLELGRRLD
ncbi:MAG: hypothetical protein U0R69_06400 [Gaiellales bacterium]